MNEIVVLPSGERVRRSLIVRCKVQETGMSKPSVVVYTADGNNTSGGHYATVEAAHAACDEIMIGEPSMFAESVTLFPRSEAEVVADMRRHVASGGTL